MYLVTIPTYLKGPIEARHSHAAVNTTFLATCITSTRERTASFLKIA
jgi:hypothetical protein